VANDYVDSTTSYGKTEILLNSNVQGSLFPAKFTNNTVYQTYIPDTLGYVFGDIDSVNQSAYRMPNIVSLTGFTNLYSPNFAKGVN
jgi:hypothetical protein